MDTKHDHNSERSLLEGVLYYISILMKYRIFIAISTAIVSVAVGVFLIFSVLLPPEASPLPNIYSADASFIIAGSEGGISASILTSLGITQSSDQYQSNTNIALDVLQSRVLIDMLIDEFNLREKYGMEKKSKGATREEVMNHFSYPGRGSRIIVSYSDIDPVLCCNMVNRSISLLDEWFNDTRGTAQQKQRKLLEDKVNEVRADIASLQNRLKNLQKKYGALTVQDLGASQSASLANLRSQLILKEIEIKNYSSFSRINDPRLEELKDQRQNLIDLINETQQNLPELDASVLGSQKSLPDVAQEFSQLTLELDIQERIYNTLSPQYEAAKLIPESDSMLQIIEMAEVPDIKSGPKRIMMLAMAIALGLIGSIGLSLLHHLFLNIKNDPEKRKYFTTKA